MQLNKIMKVEINKTGGVDGYKQCNIASKRRTTLLLCLSGFITRFKWFYYSRFGFKFKVHEKYSLLNL